MLYGLPKVLDQEQLHIFIIIIRGLGKNANIDIYKYEYIQVYMKSDA